MAFPASSTTLHNAWSNICGSALKLRSEVLSLSNQSSAGDVARGAFVDLQKRLDQGIDRWAALAAIPGLQAYARDQVADQTLDVTAEYVAMRDAAIALRDWIFNAIPRDAGSGAVLLETVNQDGDRIPIMVTTAQSAGFRTQATIFINTVG